MSEKYNGWLNYETWCVSLWLGNDEGRYRAVTEQAADFYRDAPDQADREGWATIKLAGYIQESIEDENPCTGASVFSDLMSAALGEVDWYEIAEHYIADVDKSEDEDGDEDEEAEDEPTEEPNIAGADSRMGE